MNTFESSAGSCNEASEHLLSSSIPIGSNMSGGDSSADLNNLGENSASSCNKVDLVVKKSYVSDSSAEGQQQKKTTATSGKGTGKKRGTYNSYKDEAGQLRVKRAIETFLELRRQNGNASLRTFAAEVDIKYETLKPYCRADESKRQKFVVKGQTKLVPEVRFFDIK